MGIYKVSEGKWTAYKGIPTDMQKLSLKGVSTLIFLKSWAI